MTRSGIPFQYYEAKKKTSKLKATRCKKIEDRDKAYELCPIECFPHINIKKFMTKNITQYSL